MVTDIDTLRDRYAGKLKTSLNRIVRRLSAKPEVEQVILFGSYGKGRADLLTDLDLAVVMGSEQTFLERCAKLRQELDVDVDLDLLVYTPEEWQRHRDDPFFKAMRVSGKVLYAKSRR